MKSLVVYYSHSGNTAYLAHRILRALKEKGGADVCELRYYGGPPGILKRAFYRLMPSLILLNEAPLDAKDYELLCIGAPTIGGRPAPLVENYIRRCTNISGKKIIYFQVYGVEASAERSFQYVKRILTDKGASEITDIKVDWLEVRDEALVDKTVQEAVERMIGK